jgi:gas vesicle protein
MLDKQTDTNSEQGSFASGIIVGVLAGAVGYFVSQTKEGKEMHNKFSNHWEDLKNTLIKEGKLKESNAQVADYIKAARNKISGFLGEHLVENPANKKTTKKKTTKPRKKKIFKGL